MKYSLLSILIFLTLWLNGQSTLRPMDQTIQMRAAHEYNERLYKKSNNRMLSKNTYESIDGSPYFFEEPMEASLTLVNDEVAVIKILLDRYANELISVQEDGSMRLLDPVFFSSIEIDMPDRKARLEKLHPDHPTQFYETLINGPNMILLRDIEINHLETSLITDGRRETINKFRRDTKYILVMNSEVLDIPFKKKKFMKSFSKSDANTLSNLAKENGIKLKSDEDFIQLLSLFNKTRI